MKNKLIYILFLAVILIPAQAQTLLSKPHGGAYITIDDFNYCLSNEKRSQIIESNKDVINSLKLKDGLKKITAEDSFIFPMQSNPALDYQSFYTIYNFVDHDPNYPDQLLDYNGGTRTYDRENGYNHQGTDYSPWPFAWYLMDNDLIEIISMAPGTIIGKEDGNYDRNCGFTESDWNAVYILHDNGFIAWYGHLKNGSLTIKTVGDTVEAGEFLGVVGSSGSSFSPHLHLEIYDGDYNLIDPWEGIYNNTITSSLWQNQPPYVDSKINHIATHSGWPIFPDCPQQEILNLQNEFLPGDTVYLITYYQDQLRGQISEFKVYTPANTIWAEWDHSIEEEYYSASYWGWWLILPDEAPPGDWEFLVNYENVIYSHTFTVQSLSDLDIEELPEDFVLEQNYPNPFNPLTTIKYVLPKASHVIIEIFDVLGREVLQLVNEEIQAGMHTVNFSGVDLSSGVYYYMLRAGDFVEVKKMSLIK